MLTDIFAYRYLKRPIWSNYTELERRLLNQAFGIIKDAIPYYDYEGKEIEIYKAKWKSLHDQLARELGVTHLSQRYYSYTLKNPLGQEYPVSGLYSWGQICGNFVKAEFDGRVDPDQFIKERISFVELGMRLLGDEIAEANAKLPQVLAKSAQRDANRSARIHSAFELPGYAVDGVKAWNARLNEIFEGQVEELNERFRRAKAPLTYHNGFIQVATDETIEQVIAKPFWDLVADPLWKNVDIDMKEALDRRDSNDKDPAFFAAKALESAIKIVSDNKGWTRGTEKGAAQFIDNLVSKANGSYLDVWEGELLKNYFNKVRNPAGHGPGSNRCQNLLSLKRTGRLRLQCHGFAQSSDEFKKAANLVRGRI